MKVVRKKLTADEFSPANKRYVIEDDMVQTSPDGGVTWYDDPASDPRYNPLNLLPVRGGADPQCDAAENMMQHFKAMVDAFLSSSGILQLVNLFVGLLLFIPGVNVIVALLFAIADALFVLGTEVVDAAMTDPVYDQIKCILYANIGTDGRMSAAQLVDVYADVDAQIGGVAATVFHEVTRAWGEVGFSNAGATGEYEGDCDDCVDVWCRSYTLANGELESAWFSALWAAPDNAIFETGVGWKLNTFATALYIQYELPEDANLTRVVFTYEVGDSDSIGLAIFAVPTGAPTYEHYTFPDDDPLEFDWTLPSPATDNWLQLQGNHTFVINSVTLYGTGTEPTDGEAC